MNEFPPRDRARHPSALYEPYKSTRLRAPQQPLLQMPTGPAEESGPVFGSDLIGPQDADLIHNFAAEGGTAIGPRIVVHGRVMDEFGRPVPRALLEVWQANAGGRYRHKREGYLAPLDPNFGGCGRVMTGDDGAYRFHTIMPGAYPWPNGPNSWRPAHIHFSLFGQAFAQRLVTQMYFEGDPLIPLCPIVQSVPDTDGVAALTATLDMDAAVPMDSLAYRFDIVLRGRRQTPFENRPEGM
ncbi:protocatechuate 3,4-dioxygenase subunit beta [Yoonia sp. SDW83-1]|uniref:protocatechuate 3,4-dioxygenase subunit beta n=1 Tax=Yoonia sp. SDW83-1 TaxID=3366945 RepID=UPI00398C39E3